MAPWDSQDRYPNARDEGYSMACRLENTRLPLYAALAPQHEGEVLGGHGRPPILVQPSSAQSTDGNHRSVYRAQDAGIYYRDMLDKGQ